MADRTAIEWAQATWNPIVGCSLESPGCTNCYAMRMAARLEAMGLPAYQGMTQPSAAGAVWTGKVRLDRRALHKPGQWKKPRRIFVNSMSDLFHPSVRAEDIFDVFTVMAAEERHEFMVLTKRGDRMCDFVTGRELLEDIYVNWSTVSGSPAEVYSWPLHNVLLGVSVEDQRRANERSRDLEDLAALGWRTFVSYEPALGPVDWTGWDFLAGLISGGESGPRGRPSHPDWHRAARDFCAAHGIPYFFKQWGEWIDEREATALHMAPGAEMFDSDGRPKGPKWHFYDRDDRAGGAAIRVGKAKAGRLLDGREHNALPLSREDLNGRRAAA